MKFLLLIGLFLISPASFAKKESFIEFVLRKFDEKLSVNSNNPPKAPKHPCVAKCSEKRPDSIKVTDDYCVFYVPDPNRPTRVSFLPYNPNLGKASFHSPYPRYASKGSYYPYPNYPIRVSKGSRYPYPNYPNTVSKASYYSPFPIYIGKVSYYPPYPSCDSQSEANLSNKPEVYDKGRNAAPSKNIPIQNDSPIREQRGGTGTKTR